MMNPIRWWLNRNPYVPAILRPVEPNSADSGLDKATEESAERAKVQVVASRNLTAGVVSIHNELLKLIEGNRA